MRNYWCLADGVFHFGGFRAQLRADEVFQFGGFRAQPRADGSSISAVFVPSPALMNTGSGEWQLALVLLSGTTLAQLALGLLSGMDVGGDDWQLALSLLSGQTLAATSGNSHWACQHC